MHTKLPETNEIIIQIIIYSNYLLAAVAQSLGHDVIDLNINRTSIQRGRERKRYLC